jgi:methyl-accepting chemotaxis protein
MADFTGVSVYQAGSGAFKINANFIVSTSFNVKAYVRAGLFLDCGSVASLEYSLAFWVQAFLAFKGVLCLKEVSKDWAAVNNAAVETVLTASEFTDTMEHFNTTAAQLDTQISAVHNAASRQDLDNACTGVCAGLRQTVGTAVSQVTATADNLSTEAAQVAANCNQLSAQVSSAGAGLTETAGTLSHVSANLNETALELMTVASISQRKAAVSFI